MELYFKIKLFFDYILPILFFGIPVVPFANNK